MTSLPPKVPPRHQDSPSVQSAYDICLALEKKVLEGNPDGAVGQRDLIYARILGHLIHVAPNKSVRGIIDEIFSAKDHSALLALGQHYFDHFIRAFRSNKGRTPAPSSHPSRRSFDSLADFMKSTLVAATPAHSTAKKRALFRDGFRCVLTGSHDPSILKIPGLFQKLESGPVPMRALRHTHCAHIFPESTNFNVSADSESSKTAYAASVWAVMDRFGYHNVPIELNGNSIHRLENILTLDSGIHTFFDELSVWLKATDRPNTYTVEASNPYILAGCDREVTFTTPDPAKYPLPSPDYLALHAACAQVAHLSGAAACIDEFYQDKDEQGVLDPKGGSALLLEEALRILQLTGNA